MIVIGHSVHVSVRRKCLVIRNGKTETRIEQVPKIHDRLIIDANIGIVTIEAMVWMQNYGLPWTLLWRDRGAVASSDDGRGDPETWRKQVTADPLPVTRFLTAAKYSGLAEIAELLRAPDLAKRFRGYADQSAFAGSLKELIGREGAAGRFYWALWARHVTVPFMADEMLRVPPRWIRFNRRDSLVKTNTNRFATDPVNALLNYAYKVGETLCVRACREAGLSPVLGLSHTRRHVQERDGVEPSPGMALDLLEPLRPLCDRVVLDMLDYGQGVRPCMIYRDFLELESGVVRVESRVLRERVIRECEGFAGVARGFAREVKAML